MNKVYKMKINKWLNVYILQANYGSWCDEFEFSNEQGYNTIQDRKNMLKCYRENAPQYEYRIIQRKILNLLYKG